MAWCKVLTFYELPVNLCKTFKRRFQLFWFDFKITSMLSPETRQLNKDDLNRKRLNLFARKV